MIKNIIFDFDGVIVDSEVLASKAFAKYFSKFDYTIKEEQFYKYAGKKTVDVINLLSAKYKIEDKEKFANDIFDIVSEVYSKDLKLVDGVKDFISKSKSFVVAIGNEYGFARYQIAKMLENNYGLKPINLISENAFIDENIDH